MYDASTAVLHPECDDPPTTQFWTLDSHEPTTEARHALRRGHSTDLPTLQRLLHGLQRLVP